LQPPFDLDRAWSLHPQVSIRPERFGVLLYHFGSRRLLFLKNPTLLAVVRSLDGQCSARSARGRWRLGLAAARLRERLATLAASTMICERTD